MSELVTFWIYKFTNILLAPLYFHFGHHWLFIETMVVLANVVDTLGLYFIMFFFVVLTCIYRNATFQTFIRNYFKNYSVYFNILPLSTYFQFFYNTFFNLYTKFIDSIYFLFKKRK